MKAWMKPKLEQQLTNPVCKAIITRTLIHLNEWMKEIKSISLWSVIELISHKIRTIPPSIRPDCEMIQLNNIRVLWMNLCSFVAQSVIVYQYNFKKKCRRGNRRKSLRGNFSFTTEWRDVRRWWSRISCLSFRSISAIACSPNTKEWHRSLFIPKHARVLSFHFTTWIT